MFVAIKDRREKKTKKHNPRKNPAAGQIPDGWLLRGLCHHLHHAHVDALYGFLFRTRGHKAPRKNEGKRMEWRVMACGMSLLFSTYMYDHVLAYNTIQ